MDGFKQGVEYWNEQKDDTVQVLGWDGTDGSFTGGFDRQPGATNAAQGLVDQGVDVLLPVGGPIYQSAASVIRDSGTDIALLGVDADVFETDPSVADLLLTSILKGIDVGVDDAVKPPARRIRHDPVRRHARERGRRPRAVPRLREQGLARPPGRARHDQGAASSTARSRSSPTWPS